jgi:hypothetical protein
MYGGNNVKLHAFLSSALHIGERSAGHPAKEPPLQNNGNLGGTQILWTGQDTENLTSIPWSFCRLVRAVDTVSTELTCLV